jgi:hypothetical protein
MKTNLYMLAIAGVLAGCTPGGSGLVTNANAVVLPEDEVDSVTAAGINVQTDRNLAAGQVVISDEGEGLVRRISSVTPTGFGQVRGQAVRKFYVQTTAASLEDAVASGEANLDWGTLAIGEDTKTQSLEGVESQAFTGRINLTNVTFSPPGVTGVSITLNGFIEQNLQPNFNLKFSSGSIESFRAGIKGSFTASIKASIQANKSYSPFSLNKDLATWNIRRAFLVGAVPVVVVLQPKLVAGVSSNAAGQVKVEVGIAPTFTTDVQLDYSRLRAPAQRWQNSFNASFALNPTFKYDTPAGGKAEAATGLNMDIKFYGLAGPSLEAKPFMNLTLNAANPTASLKSGINGSSKVEAGFKVLGKGLETAYAGPAVEKAKSFSCQAPSTCTAN